MGIHNASYTHLVLTETTKKCWVQVLASNTLHQMLHITITAIVGIKKKWEGHALLLLPLLQICLSLDKAPAFLHSVGIQDSETVNPLSRLAA